MQSAFLPPFQLLFRRWLLATLAIAAGTGLLASPTLAADSPYGLSPTFVQSQADAGARVYACLLYTSALPTNREV